MRKVVVVPGRLVNFVTRLSRACRGGSTLRRAGAAVRMSRCATSSGPASSVVPVLTPGIAGMTLGRWILLRRGHEHDRGLIAHELVHVRQWRELGARASSSATSARTPGAGGAGSATGPPTRPSRSRPRRALVSGR